MGYQKSEGLQFKPTGTKSSIKDVDELKGVVTGYGAHFNNKDTDNEIIDSGAFARTISYWGPEGKDRVKLLRSHSIFELLGKPTLLKEDDEGLYHESLISKTALGMDTLRLLADKVLTEHSVGFDILDAYPDFDDEDIWHLKELRLYEISLVPWGANEQTPVLGLKSEIKTLDEFTEHTSFITDYFENAQKALRRGTWNTDEVPTMIEIMIKRLQPVVNLIEKSRLLGEAQDATRGSPEGSPESSKSPDKAWTESAEQPNETKDADNQDAVNQIAPDYLADLVAREFKSAIDIFAGEKANLEY